jgi:hypothetical protein
MRFQLALIASAAQGVAGFAPGRSVRVSSLHVRCCRRSLLLLALRCGIML